MPRQFKIDFELYAHEMRGDGESESGIEEVRDHCRRCLADDDRDACIAWVAECAGIIRSRNGRATGITERIKFNIAREKAALVADANQPLTGE